MSEDCQDPFSREEQDFQFHYNGQFPLAHFLPDQHSPFKEFEFPLSHWHLLNPSQADPPKIDLQHTSAHNPPAQIQRVPTATSPQAAHQRIVFEHSVAEQCRTVFRGQKDDTVQLNIHFKTILGSFLKELVLANELDSFQLARLQHFVRRVPSFKSLKELLGFRASPGSGEGGLRRVCLEFVESGECMRRVLSSRCSLGTKLHMIKYVQRLGMNMKREEIVKWKEERKMSGL